LDRNYFGRFWKEEKHPTVSSIIIFIFEDILTSMNVLALAFSSRIIFWINIILTFLANELAIDLSLPYLLFMAIVSSAPHTST
jgi:hypothetical protein